MIDKNEKVVVTIAVATYNCGQYIKDCLNSVLEQTYSSIELLIIDDGSTDNTSNVCEDFCKDERVKYIKKENGGLSSARQLALELAQGDYICFIDADDTLSSDYVITMLSCLEENKADICICGVNFIGLDGKSKLVKPKLNGKSLSFDKMKIAESYVKFAGLTQASDSWNKMYRLKFLKDAKISFHMIKGLNGTDKLFNNEILLHCPNIVSANDCLYNHISRPVSMVNRKNKRLYLMNEYIIQSLYELALKNNINTDMFSAQLVEQYYYGLQRAFQDIYDMRSTRGELLTNIKECYKSNNSFLNKNENYMRVKNRSFIVFIMRFLSKHILLLCVYLEARRKLR